MFDFEGFISRHGEFGVQAIVERIERYDGISSGSGASLEERWNLVMSLGQCERAGLAAA